MYLEVDLEKRLLKRVDSNQRRVHPTEPPIMTAKSDLIMYPHKIIFYRNNIRICSHLTDIVNLYPLTTCKIREGSIY